MATSMPLLHHLCAKYIYIPLTPGFKSAWHQPDFRYPNRPSILHYIGGCFIVSVIFFFLNKDGASAITTENKNSNNQGGPLVVFRTACLNTRWITHWLISQRRRRYLQTMYSALFDEYIGTLWYRTLECL